MTCVMDFSPAVLISATEARYIGQQLKFCTLLALSRESSGHFPIIHGKDSFMSRWLAANTMSGYLYTDFSCLGLMSRTWCSFYCLSWQCVFPPGSVTPVISGAVFLGSGPYCISAQIRVGQAAPSVAPFCTEMTAILSKSRTQGHEWCVGKDREKHGIIRDQSCQNGRRTMRKQTILFG